MQTSLCLRDGARQSVSATREVGRVGWVEVEVEDVGGVGRAGGERSVSSATCGMTDGSTCCPPQTLSGVFTEERGRPSRQ